MKNLITIILINIILMVIILILSLVFIKNRFITSYIKNIEGKNLYLELAEDVGHYTSYRAISKGIEGKLGFRENSNITHKLINKKQTIYDVKYNIDSIGNRKTINNLTGDSNLYIFGCSDVFGIGLNDEDTLASQLSKKLSNIKVHNQGIPASSTNVFYYLLTEQKQIELKKGDKVIYVAAEGHIGRNSGRVTPYMGHFPEYGVQKSGLTYKGSFNKSIFGDFVRKTILESWLVELVNFNSSYFLTNSDERLTCELIDSSLRYISSKYAEFVVLLHPDLRDFERETFLRCGTLNPQIKYLNVIWGPDKDEEFFIPVDGHPSSRGNQDLAEKIYKFYSKK